MPSQQEGWRGTRSWEGTQPGKLTQNVQRGIPYHVMSCPVYKLGGVGQGVQIAAWELTGHRSVGGELLHSASLVLYIPIFLLLLLLLLLSFYYYYRY